MKQKTINLLIIEDCNIIANAYKTIVDSILNRNFKISFAQNCDEAQNQIEKNNYQLILLDLQLPVSKNNKYVCGEDLGALIRQTQKKTKIIVLTNVSSYIRINNIINELNPEGFIVKTDIDTKDLKNAIELVLQGKNYYSKTMQKHVGKVFDTIYIDDLDRQILYHLSMGEKTKNIYNYMPLSHRAIEVRKNKLKSLLIDKDDNSSNLVKEAKKLGIV